MNGPSNSNGHNLINPSSEPVAQNPSLIAKHVNADGRSWSTFRILNVLKLMIKMFPDFVQAYLKREDKESLQVDLEIHGAPK